MKQDIVRNMERKEVILEHIKFLQELTRVVPWSLGELSDIISSLTLRAYKQGKASWVGSDFRIQVWKTKDNRWHYQFFLKQAWGVLTDLKIKYKFNCKWGWKDVSEAAAKNFVWYHRVVERLLLGIWLVLAKGPNFLEFPLSYDGEEAYLEWE